MDKETINALNELKEAVKQVLPKLGTIGINRRGKMVGRMFQSKQSFNFILMGNGRGLNHFTIRNTGNHKLIIEDTKEEIAPGEQFIIESNIAVMNDKFMVSFGAKVGNEASDKQAVVRYIVDYDRID